MRTLTRRLFPAFLGAFVLAATSFGAESLQGRIVRIQPDSLSLALAVRGQDAPIPVQATNETRVSLNGEAARFSALAVDDHAAVEGSRNERGQFVATSIRARRNTDEGEGLAGIVKEVNPDRRLLTLVTRRGEVVVHAADQARIVIDGQPARFADIQPRDRARCQGQFDRQRVFQARAISIQRDSGGDDGDRARDFGQWARGAVQRIDYENRGFVLRLSRGPLPVKTTDGTPILDENGNRIRFDQLQGDERVEVIGHLRRSDDRRQESVLVALRIQIIR
ncbi:MAG: DUF5666 domain-containing protein [Planctomycetota bacterium]